MKCNVNVIKREVDCKRKVDVIKCKVQCIKRKVDVIKRKVDCMKRWHFSGFSPISRLDQFKLSLDQT